MVPMRVSGVAVSAQGRVHPGPSKRLLGAYEVWDPQSTRCCSSTSASKGLWRLAAASSDAASLGGACAHDPAEQLAAVASILAGATDQAVDYAAITDSGTHACALDSVEEDARRLLLTGAPAPLDADALATAVGILRARLEDEGSACALSSRLADLLQLLDTRPSSSSGAAAGAAASDKADPASADAFANGAAKGFWGQPDEWSDIRTALMSVGVDATVDEDDGLTAGASYGGGSPPLRLDAGAAGKLAAFLSELNQQRLTPPLAVAAAAPAAGAGARGASASTAGDGARRSGAGADDGLSAGSDEALWWEAATAAYGRLWEEAKAQQAA